MGVGGLGIGNRALFIVFNAIWALTGSYFLFRGFQMQKKGGGARLFAENAYGVGCGYLLIVAFIDWAVARYFLQ